MRLNLVEDAFEEMMEWNSAPSSRISSACETQKELHEENPTSATCNVNDVS
jgi:hypothetical protein